MWEPPEPPSARLVGERLPRFKVEKTLGQGALGVVYGATDKHLGRTVAIKVMLENSQNPEYSKRFEREAATMAKLHHPNVVSIFDSGKVDDLHYLVMERMEAGSLAGLIAKKGAQPVERTSEIIGQICSALDYVHRLGVIHRDVKPSNILIDKHGNAKLSDFGLVNGVLHEEFDEVALTRSDVAVGTPQYMAPEQMESPSQVNYRADIYSAGAVLYEMLTGAAPTGRHQAASKSAWCAPLCRSRRGSSDA